MKHLFTKKQKTKKPKPVAIENYKVSYLDKRSKRYHRIVMTAFSGLFGLVGMLYVFTSNAATGEVAPNNNNILAVVAIVLGGLFITGLMVYFYIRSKQK